MLTLAERTRQALDAGYSNSQLAKAAGVSTGAVSQWLNKTKTLKAQSVLGLAKLTGWRAEWWERGVGPREEASKPSVSPVAIPAMSESDAELLAIIQGLDEVAKAKVIGFAAGLQQRRPSGEFSTPQEERNRRVS